MLPANHSQLTTYCRALAVVVSCLPSFRAFFSSRSSPYWKREGPESNSHLSRFSRSRQRKIRLDTLASNEADTADFSEYPGTGYGSDSSGGRTSQKGQTGYSAAAEGLKDLEPGTRDRVGGDSREHILPKMPENSVHVRNDFVGLTIPERESYSNVTLLVHDVGNCLRPDNPVRA